jgi:hypothetical protein
MGEQQTHRELRQSIEQSWQLRVEQRLAAGNGKGGIAARESACDAQPGFCIELDAFPPGMTIGAIEVTTPGDDQVDGRGPVPSRFQRRARPFAEFHASFSS